MTAPQLARPLAGAARRSSAAVMGLVPADTLATAPRRRPQPVHIAAPGRRTRSAVAPRRRGTRRPAGAPPVYGRPGVRLSRASHRRRITPSAVVGLSLLAALITVWLGAVAQLGAAETTASGAAPGVASGEADRLAADTHRLAIVEVGQGETIEHLAARVAPQTPIAEVVTRIRELNALPTTVVAAGQTLVTPVD